MAFDVCCWCDNVSPRKAENDVVDFYIFDRKQRTEKVDIGNAEIGLRRETFSYEQRIRSLCARTKNLLRCAIGTKNVGDN